MVGLVACLLYQALAAWEGNDGSCTLYMNKEPHTGSLPNKERAVSKLGMEPVEMELPCRTDTLEVWMDIANSEDSGVEVFRPSHSCGSSGVSGCSENEVASESGSETYTPSTMQMHGSHLKRLDTRDAGSETCSDTSSTHENQHSGHTSRQSCGKSKVFDSRTRPELKPKVPAKPSTLTRARKTLPQAKPEGNDGRWPFTSHKAASRSRGNSAADPARKSTSTAFITSPSSASATTRPINITDNSRRSGPSSLNIMTSSVHQNGSNMASSFNGSTMHHSMTQSFGVGYSTESQSSALEKYGTLPRRKKKDAVEGTSPGVTRSNSREPSLNRAATLRRQQSREKDGAPGGGVKSLPPYPRGRKPPSPKTIIFHEVSVQTALTAKDLDRPLPHRVSGDSTDQSIQTEGNRLVSIDEVERLKKEQEEVLKRIQRVLGLDPSNEVSLGLLYDLEKHVATVGRTVMKQREELQELRLFKANAHRNLEKSLSARKSLMQQLQAVESEQAELQEFLQAEKSTLSESLLDADDEISRLKEQVVSKTAELAEQQEQCKHLVRVCEQRRQENLSLEAKLAGLEQRSREVFRQQGAAVSGAAVALTSLGTRLDGLVDQLALCYNVSDKDLEDVIFHNEAFREGSPDLQIVDNVEEKVPAHSSSRRKSSILNAVLSAIRSATESPSSLSAAESRRRSSVPLTPPDQSSESFGILDAELDPSLALDKSSASGDSESCSLPPARSASLQNLSAAILQRQKTEEEEATSRFLDTGLPPDVNTLVDHVIHVDNLVTKLLKVMRIAQMESDACLDQLTDNRAELDERLRLETANHQMSEERLRRVEEELQDARLVLNNRIQQLEEAQRLLTESWRRESDRQYSTIDHALETLQTMQDVVMQFPPLVKLQQQLEDCNFRTAAGDDLNANSPANPELTNGSSVRTSHI